MLTIDRTEAELYIRLHAQHAHLAKQLDELKKKLLPQLVDGAVSPADLPYLLVNKPQKRKERDWEGFIVKLLRPIFGSTKKAAAEFAKIDSRWPTKDIPALHVEKNPEYAKQLGETA